MSRDEEVLVKEVNHAFELLQGPLSQNHFERVQESIGLTLNTICESLVEGNLENLIEAISESNSQQTKHGVPFDELAYQLLCIKEVLQVRYPKDAHSWGELIDLCLENFPQYSISQKDGLNLNNPLGEVAAQYLAYTLNQDSTSALNLLMGKLDKGETLTTIYSNVIEVAQHELGCLWQLGRISVAQEHATTEISRQVMAALSAKYMIDVGLTSGEKTVVSVCTHRDRHDMGLRMITDILIMDGWKAYYLGTNTALDDVIKLVKGHKPELLLLSVSMISYLDDAQEMITVLKEDDSTASIKVLVGGYPFNLDPSLWRRIGAHGFASRAGDIVQEANKLSISHRIGITSQKLASRMSGEGRSTISEILPSPKL